MLESVFIMIMVMGFVLFLVGIEAGNVIYNAVSMFMWIIIMAGQLYIEVPAGVDVPDTLSGIYDEPALLAVSLAFIFVNVLLIIYNFSDLKEKIRFRL